MWWSETGAAGDARRERLPKSAARFAVNPDMTADDEGTGTGYSWSLDLDVSSLHRKPATSSWAVSWELV